MHAVGATGSPLPRARLPILNETQPCVQAAAFRAERNLSLAVLNICNRSIALTIEDPTAPQTGTGRTTATATATAYSLADPGGKAPLPPDPDAFPWAAPLRARRVNASASAFVAPALSFVMLEVTWP